MNLILFLLQASFVQVIIAVITGLISGSTTARLISLVNQSISQGFASGKFADDLLWQFAFLVLVVVVSGITSQILLINLSQGAVYRLRLRFSQEILSTPLRHLEELGANRLLATLTDDVTTLSNTIFAIPFICIDTSIIIGCLIYLAWLSTPVFAFTAGFLLLSILTVQLQIKRGNHYFLLAREEQDNLFKDFRAITDGVKELKLNSARRQQFFSEELQQTAGKSRDYNISALLTYAIAMGWGNLLLFTFIGLFLFLFPSLLNISPSLLSSYILTIIYMMLPLQTILERIQAIARADVALNKIRTLGLAIAAQQENNLTPLSPINQTWQTLELRQVTHNYPTETEDSNFVLGALDLTFHGGEIIFLIGGNGSGKSTLAKIITGLYIPEQGEILLDNTPIDDKNREWYRQHFSVVFSDYFLFDKLLGFTNTDLDTEAKNYLHQLNLDKKVKVSDGKLSTTALSQGQRKRLALLTAYLENRPIYLFDEWASDQDPMFREIFYQQILANLKARGKTVFVISHDDHYFHIADRIIKLDYGQIEYDRRNPGKS
ncbi:cyclic peptide export ABC transporter [Calothrix sp. 336/3]|uniref:cyclic peptide export ABC transporter n=1 Tax=Calothrix sp. 336/3 TaxID=1337936 RepID=UPI0004E336EE|nr:cyclic peptide export ABC transporter [Calothrix sp. 336/3]AKG20344.1 ABC transporter ATP-binding protein [Calothrix sp. 336/3]